MNTAASTNGVPIRAQLVFGTEAFTGNSKNANWTIEGIERVVGFGIPRNQSMCEWTRGSQIVVICPESGYKALDTNAFHRAWNGFALEHELAVGLRIRTTQNACGVDTFHSNSWLVDKYWDYQPSAAPVGLPPIVWFLTKEFFEVAKAKAYWQYALDHLLPRDQGLSVDYEGGKKLLRQFAKKPEAVLKAGLVRYTAPPYFCVCPEVTVLRYKNGTVGGSQGFPLKQG